MKNEEFIEMMMFYEDRFYKRIKKHTNFKKNITDLSHTQLERTKNKINELALKRFKL